ncbi:unnamed protein product [Xylocopa violacea]|uniref:Uncharacterized protein n=1 Tax=Xylocopa violacea TaxID=135666 RepID=A0ABP1P8R9_XYLVO
MCSVNVSINVSIEYIWWVYSGDRDSCPLTYNQAKDVGVPLSRRTEKFCSKNIQTVEQFQTNNCMVFYHPMLIVINFDCSIRLPEILEYLAI